MADKTHFQSFLPFNHLNNSSFNLAVYEFSPGPLSHDAVLKHYYLILLKGPNCLIRFLFIWIPTLTLSLTNSGYWLGKT